MTHYFTNDNLQKRVYELEASIYSRSFKFLTSDGVFSKSGVDAGTLWLLEAVIPLIPNGSTRVCDLGCGYGAIGVALAVFFPYCECYMYDVNEQAVALANENAARAGVSGRARALCGDGLGGAGGFEYVLTNPPFRAGKQTVVKFFTESHAALVPGGTLFAVLRKQQGAESYIREISGIFRNCEAILKKKGYVVVKAVKASEGADL